MRIVSLIPSATEIVCRLGLQSSLVGVSHECDFPPLVDKLPRVTESAISKNQPSIEIDRDVREQLATNTALYSLDLDVLEELKPDLIVTQALCDVCAVSAEDVEVAIRQLPSRPRVINLEPFSLDDVLVTVKIVAKAAGCDIEGSRLIREMTLRINSVRKKVATRISNSRQRVAQLEWIDPLFNAGHWAPELIELAGGVSVTATVGQRSRSLEWQELVASEPDVLFIACCGLSADRALQDLPMLTRMPGWGELPCCRTERVYVADGNHYFNRPGPRLVDSLEILADALHPGLDILPRGVAGALQVLDASAA